MNHIWIVAWVSLAALVALPFLRRGSSEKSLRSLASSAEHLGRLRERREVVEWLLERDQALAMRVADAEHTHRDRERAQA